jgi:hypothetical protein
METKNHWIKVVSIEEAHHNSILEYYGSPHLEVWVESYEEQKKVLPWDNAGHKDPLRVPTLERSIFPLIGDTKVSIGM